MPVGTLRSWIDGRSYQTQKGQQQFASLIQRPSPNHPELSFANLVEIPEVTTNDSDTPLTRIRERIIERLRTLHRTDPTAATSDRSPGTGESELTEAISRLVFSPPASPPTINGAENPDLETEHLDSPTTEPDCQSTRRHLAPGVGGEAIADAEVERFADEAAGELIARNDGAVEPYPTADPAELDHDRAEAARSTCPKTVPQRGADELSGDISDTGGHRQLQRDGELGDRAGVAGDSAADQSAGQQHRDSVGADGAAVGVSEAQVKQGRAVAKTLIQWLKRRQVLAVEGKQYRVAYQVENRTLSLVALDGRGEILRGVRGAIVKMDLVERDLEMVQRMRERLEVVQQRKAPPQKQKGLEMGD
jgi:hypothetical protein